MQSHSPPPEHQNTIFSWSLKRRRTHRKTNLRWGCTRRRTATLKEPLRALRWGSTRRRTMTRLHAPTQQQTITIPKELQRRQPDSDIAYTSTPRTLLQVDKIHGPKIGFDLMEPSSRLANKTDIQQVEIINTTIDRCLAAKAFQHP
ncbi:hypothetical protein LguiB_013765 [Lonicera macranthoides]